MKLSVIFFLIAVLYTGSFLAHSLYLGKSAYGDGLYYYAWLRSIAMDSDYHFENEYKALGLEGKKTFTGLTANVYSIGPAILWIPGYLLVHSIIRGTGYELAYQLAVGLMSVGYGLIGLLLLYRLLITRFDEGISSLVIISIAGASHLLFYGAVDPINSHALSFFAASLFLTCLFMTPSRGFLLGITLGLLTLIRPQDGLYILCVLAVIKKIHIKRFLLGFLLVFLIQCMVSYLFYGIFFTSPYFAEGLRFTRLGNPEILGVLFSPGGGGLFIWTPISILAIFGLFHTALTHNTKYAWYFLLLFGIQVVLIGSWIIWWQGATYSGRMFVSILPIMGFGLGYTYQVLQKKGWTTQAIRTCIVAPLCILNVTSIIIFLLQT